jgi:hypothetical protein
MSEIEELDSSEEILETVETVTDETEEDQDDTAKKNKSNWKKVSEKAKQAEKLERRVAELEASLEEWESTNPDIAESKKENKRVERLEEEIFLARNAEAEEHLDDINALTTKYNGMTRKEAWEFLKAKMPQESKSKTDFSTKSAPVNTKKKLDDMNEEEALKLDKAQYSKWAEKKYGF